MRFARTHIFVRRNAQSYLMVSALQHGLSVIYFRRGRAEPLRIEYIYDQQCVFVNGAWDLPALTNWLKSREISVKVQIDVTVQDEVSSELVVQLRDLICDLRAAGAEVAARLNDAQFEAFCEEDE